jgi:outer membrane lipoprotein SlyB
MKKALLTLALIALVTLSGCTSAQAYHSPTYNFGKLNAVAVLDVTAGRIGEGRENQIADMFEQLLMQRGYRVVERKRIQQILAEQDLQASDRTSSSQAARIGRILNVQGVITASIPHWGDRTTISAKMVDTETAEVVWSGEATAKSYKTAATVGGAVVGAGTGWALGGDTEGEVIGGAIGGVAGGAAGHYLTPSNEKQVRKALTKLVNTLP